MYLPKSKYRANLYTTGDEFALSSTGANYVGPYFETYLSEFYTGEQPSSDSEHLHRQQGQTIDNRLKPGKGVYDHVRNRSHEVKLKDTLPVPIYYPRPGNGDILLRYFAIDKTTQRVVEVSKDTYISLRSKEPEYYYPKYELKTLDWSLLNASVNRVNAAVAGLDSYLKDPSQFVR